MAPWKHPPKPPSFLTIPGARNCKRVGALLYARLRGSGGVPSQGPSKYPLFWGWFVWRFFMKWGVQKGGQILGVCLPSSWTPYLWSDGLRAPGVPSPLEIWHSAIPPAQYGPWRANLGGETPVALGVGVFGRAGAWWPIRCALVYYLLHRILRSSIL